MRSNEPRSALAQLADIITKRERVKPTLAASSTDTGPDVETRDDGLPLPLGGVGDVLTVLASGDDIYPGWALPTGGGGAGGRYRDIMYELDGLGGFDWITDADGNPMYELRELE